jgi:hypothetical protein
MGCIRLDLVKTGYIKTFYKLTFESPVILEWKDENTEEDDKKEELAEKGVNGLIHEKEVTSDQKEKWTPWNQDSVLLQSANDLSSKLGSKAWISWLKIVFQCTVVTLTSCVMDKMTRLDQLRILNIEYPQDHVGFLKQDLMIFYGYRILWNSVNC